MFGENIANLSTTLSVVPEFSEDARNMVRQRTLLVVHVISQCLENAPLQYAWIAKFWDTATVDQIYLSNEVCRNFQSPFEVKIIC